MQCINKLYLYTFVPGIQAYACTLICIRLWGAKNPIVIPLGTYNSPLIVLKSSWSVSTLHHYDHFKFAVKYISNYAAFCGIVSDVLGLACYLHLISKCRVSRIHQSRTFRWTLRTDTYTHCLDRHIVTKAKPFTWNIYLLNNIMYFGSVCHGVGNEL